MYAQAMYNVALRIIKEPQDAEDILQEAFVKVYNKIDQFEYQATFGAWLKKIVINQALDVIRRRKIYFSDEVEELKIVHDEVVDWNEIDFTVERVKKAVLELPTGFNLVCSLFLFEGYDHKEIANIMGISESTSKSQYHRAKLKIREMLKRDEG